VATGFGPAERGGFSTDAGRRRFAHRLHQLVDGAASAIAGEYEDINVFREPLHDAEALGKARSALEDEVVAELSDKYTEDFADPVVLLDGRWADIEALGYSVERWTELSRVAEASHRSACEREVVTDRIASSGSHGLRIFWPAECIEQTAKPLTNARRLSWRGAHEPIEAKCSMLGEVRDAADGLVGADLHEGVPVPEHLEQRDLGRAESRVSTLSACGAADESDGARVPRRAAGYGDRLASRHLGGEPEC
jgi:hypothetical protein